MTITIYESTQLQRHLMLQEILKKKSSAATYICAKTEERYYSENPKKEKIK